jgi:hypothetical protein
MRSLLGDTYYASSNVDFLQNEIISSVKSATGYTIGKQDPMDLYNLMRKVYTDYMVVDYDDIPNQVSKMNDAVIRSATRTISSGIIQNLVYLRDISVLPVPPDAPRNTSTYGLKLSRV